MDIVETSLYKNCIRLRHASLERSIEDISLSRNFDNDQKYLFGIAALLASILAVEIKDDQGSLFVTLKSKSKNISVTAICETDGRLRGYSNELDEIIDDYEYMLVIGKRLYVRGDYQSAVTGDSPESLIYEYFKNSSQTKFKSYLNIENNKYLLIVSEFMPGHDITLSDEYYENNGIEGLIEKSIKSLLNNDIDAEDIISDNKVDIYFGCTCSKRKLHMLLQAQNIDIVPGMQIQCKQCGKIYTFE